MHVVVWEIGSEAVTYGPFPEVEADIWLHDLGIVMDGYRVRARTAVVNPAYDLRTFIPTHLGETSRPHILVQRGTGLDWRAYGFVARIMQDDKPRGLAGMWRSRDDATAWWSAQDGVLALSGVTHADVLPILAVPSTIEQLLLNDADLKD